MFYKVSITRDLCNEWAAYDLRSEIMFEDYFTSYEVAKECLKMLRQQVKELFNDGMKEVNIQTSIIDYAQELVDNDSYAIIYTSDNYSVVDGVYAEIKEIIPKNTLAEINLNK